MTANKIQIPTKCSKQVLNTRKLLENDVKSKKKHAYVVFLAIKEPFF